MSSSTLEKLAADTACRLRMIQVDFAGESEQTQNEYIREQLSEVLKQIPAADQGSFMNLLKTHFPVATDLYYQESKSSESPAGSMEQYIRNNPEALIQAFSGYTASLGNEDKKELARRLFGLDLEAPVRPSGADGVADSLQKELNIKNKPVLADHVVVQYKLLLEFMNQIEHLVWNTWSALSPKSKIHPKGNLSEILNRYLTEDAQASYDDMTNSITQLKRFTTAMVNAIAKAGGLFANQFLTTYTPSAIETLVKMEGSGFWTSEEVKCWAKYKQLTGSLTKDSIENQIRKAMIEYIESLPNLGRI